MRNQTFNTKHTKDGIERYNRQQNKKSVQLRAQHFKKSRRYESRICLAKIYKNAKRLKTRLGKKERKMVGEVGYKKEENEKARKVREMH